MCKNKNKTQIPLRHIKTDSKNCIWKNNSLSGPSRLWITWCSWPSFAELVYVYLAFNDGSFLRVCPLPYEVQRASDCWKVISTALASLSFHGVAYRDLPHRTGGGIGSLKKDLAACSLIGTSHLRTYTSFNSSWRWNTPRSFSAVSWEQFSV